MSELLDLLKRLERTSARLYMVNGAQAITLAHDGGACGTAEKKPWRSSWSPRIGHAFRSAAYGSPIEALTAAVRMAVEHAEAQTPGPPEKTARGAGGPTGKYLDLPDDLFGSDADDMSDLF